MTNLGSATQTFTDVKLVEGVSFIVSLNCISEGPVSVTWREREAVRSCYLKNNREPKLTAHPFPLEQTDDGLI